MKDDEEKCKLIDNHKERVCKLLDRNNHFIIYSDGSMIKKRGFPQVGATVVSYHNGEEVFLETMGMGGRTEVYDTEMAGLMMGVKLALRYTRDHPEITQIVFYVDNSAVARAIFDPKPCPGQLYAAKFHHRMTKFLNTDKTHAIEVAWCPSHCNIKGNDRADELAKEATQLAWNAPIGTSRAFALR